MIRGNPVELAAGGACAMQLSADAGCAVQARKGLASVMRALDFPASSIDDGMLAVSELAANARLHASGHRPGGAAPTFELWLWARSMPRRELVVSVFDDFRGAMPEIRCGGLMNAHGRGLGIVEALALEWGWRWTRSRSADRPVPGKAVWFSVPLPSSWPRPPWCIPPLVAARHLVAGLVRRDVPAARRSDGTGVSVVTTVSSTSGFARGSSPGRVRADGIIAGRSSTFRRPSRRSCISSVRRIARCRPEGGLSPFSNAVLAFSFFASTVSG
jgi:hypothetical protein